MTNDRKTCCKVKDKKKKKKKWESKRGRSREDVSPLWLFNLHYKFRLFNYWSEQCLKQGGEGLLILLSVVKFQVGTVGGDAFGWQALSFRQVSAWLAILIVSIQTLPFQYLMFASLFSLIIQLTVISSWNGRAGAGSVSFPGLWHGAKNLDQPAAISIFCGGWMGREREGVSLWSA